MVVFFDVEERCGLVAFVVTADDQCCAVVQGQDSQRPSRWSARLRCLVARLAVSEACVRRRLQRNDPPRCREQDPIVSRGDAREWLVDRAGACARTTRRARIRRSLPEGVDPFYRVFRGFTDGLVGPRFVALTRSAVPMHRR